MNNKLSQWVGRILLLILAAALSIVLVFIAWKYFTFRAILSDILHPDWSEVSSITSYRYADSVYTQYTEDNGRNQAEQALESIRLGLPDLRHGKLFAGGCFPECVVVELTFTDGQRQRIAFYPEDGDSGYIVGQGEVAIAYRGPALRELQAAELERSEASIYLVAAEPGTYSCPVYRS